MLITQALEHFEDQMYVAFSGGKDSSVLLDLVWSIDPTIPAVFSDTGNELDSIKENVRSYGNRVVWVNPKMSFDEVVDKFGYPVVSKKMSDYINRCRRTSNPQVLRRHLNGENADGSPSPMSKISTKWQHLIDGEFDVTNKCCGILKNKPTSEYRKNTGRFAFVGTMADESQARRNSYINEGGCNAFEQKDPCSRPLMFWTEQDILQYHIDKDLPMASAYGVIQDKPSGLRCSGDQRTGCKFCLFGVHLEKGENRIQRLARVEPESYRHAIEDLGYDKVMDAIGVDWKPFKLMEQKDMFDEGYNVDAREL